MLKHYPEVTEPNPHEIGEMTFADLIRAGCERNLLLSDLDTWKIYRHECSITSHTYDKQKAEEVFKSISSFLQGTKYLLTQFKSRMKVS